MPGVTHRYWELGEVRLHGVEQGRGPLLVLLHGFPACWLSWRELVGPLSSTFRVVAPDLRGYNLSDKPQRVSAYRMDKLVADVARLIEALGEEQAVVVGHDWGGAVAWATAAFRPERVRRLVVLNCPHPAAMGRQLRSDLRQVLRSWYILAFQVPRIPEWWIAHRMKSFLRRSFDGLCSRPAFSAEDLDLYGQALLRPGALTGSINYYRAAFRQNVSAVRQRWRAIQVPTLLLWGYRDPVLGREMAEASARYVEAPFELRFVDCGHWVQNELPDTVLAALRET
ncbi:MAG: alpha/beta hydrolase [Armatimonadetes bacterium]|nr:alpha/beta hydrolase [Armatimonadota bacterium]